MMPCVLFPFLVIDLSVILSIVFLVVLASIIAIGIRYFSKQKYNGEEYSFSNQLNYNINALYSGIGFENTHSHSFVKEENSSGQVRAVESDTETIVPIIPEKSEEKVEQIEDWLRDILEIDYKDGFVRISNFNIVKPSAKFVKRAFDIVFSVLALIFLLPVYLLISILIKIDSKGPVFYKPIRVGYGDKEFTLLKFRTMDHNDDERNGTKSTQVNDPRITRVGKYLRKYSLDELPQFINVLLGDMSVIGPRPHRVSLHEQMRNEIHGYSLREYTKPGISGWAQVNGWRGPTITHDQLVNRTTHDLWYMRHWSLLLDIKIVLLTIFGRKVHLNAF